MLHGAAPCAGMASRPDQNGNTPSAPPHLVWDMYSGGAAAAVRLVVQQAAALLVGGRRGQALCSIAAQGAAQTRAQPAV
jgi:hypothetical protein